MAMNTPGGNSTLRILALTSGLGCSVAAALIGLIGGGVLLDRRFETSPIWTLVGLGAGLIVVAIEMLTIVRISRSRSASTPFPRSSRPPDPGDDEDDY